MINSEMTFDYSEVIHKLSEPLRKKLEHSVELLRKAERLALAYDDVYGYYLAFSGGKDSQCLYHVAKLAGVRFKAHMNLTSVDPPEVIRFVKREYPDVELVKPKKSIFQAAVDNQILPTMRVRWCCAEYKETAGAGKVTLIGIRRAESARRAKRNEVEIDSRKFSGDLEGLEEYRKARNRDKRGRKPKDNREVTIVNADGERVLGCIRGKESLLISPIIDWTDDEVWEFLGALGVEHCELYDEGWRRIGCIGCPMSSHKQKMIENKRYPHVKRNWIKAIKAIRNGGVFKREYSGGTSARTGCLSETSEDCSEHRRLHQSSRPKALDWGARIRGAAMPTFRICKQWMRTNDNWETKQRDMETRGKRGFQVAPLLTA